MAEIVVKEKGKGDTYLFGVTVKEGGSTSNHQVEMDSDFYKNLATKTSKREVVRKSFKFLLEREPKEAILSKFNIRVIANYFPEYKERLKKF